MSDKTGGPAFPRPQVGMGNNWGETEASVPGMSLRAWFAGQALASFMGGYLKTAALATSRPPGDEVLQIMAKLCFQAADAMLAEMDK